PHTRLMVSAGTPTGRPALSAACLATFIPTPACSTHPISTSSMSAGDTFARAIASRIATAPRSTADKSLSAPPNDPIGVRHALTRSASTSLGKGPYLIQNNELRSSSRLDALDGRVRGDFAKDQTGRRHLDDRHLCDNEVDDVQSGKRQGAPFQDLVPAVLDRMFHRDDHLLGAGDEVHRAAHPLHHLAGNHPVREIPRLIDLQCTEHREIDML